MNIGRYIGGYKGGYQKIGVVGGVRTAETQAAVGAAKRARTGAGGGAQTDNVLKAQDGTVLKEGDRIRYIFSGRDEIDEIVKIDTDNRTLNLSRYDKDSFYSWKKFTNITKVEAGALELTDGAAGASSSGVKREAAAEAKAVTAGGLKPLHSLQNPENVSQLISLAKEFEWCYPNHQKLSLGQSPAWLIKTMSLLGGNPDDYKYVPFSGRWTKGYRQNYPSAEQKKAYKEYLTRIGVSPSSISNLYEEEKKHTVLFETTHHGDGLKSFLGFMDMWRREEGIRDANWTKMFKVQVLYHHFGIPKLGCTDYVINFSKVPQELFVDLANSDHLRDRLVPRCHSWDWLKTKEPSFGQDQIDPEKIRFFESLIREALELTDG